MVSITRIAAHSPPDLAHHARDRDDIIGQAMSPGFLPDAIPDNLFQVIDRRAGPQWLEQVDLFVTQQTQAQHTVRGQARARTTGAKWMGHTADKAERTACAGNA